MRLVPGSGRLMALRWLMFVVAALPGMAAGLGGIGESIGNRPYFSAAPDPLPLIPLVRMVELVPGPVWAALLLAAVTAWVGNLLLTAGAVTLFDPARRGRPRIWRMVFDAGANNLWAYLRISLTALVLVVVGARVIAMLAEQILEHGQVAGWTMRSRFMLHVGRGLATVCWLTLVGVFAWWCRVIVAADGRRRVRRLWAVVPRLWWRRPFAALLPHLLLALFALLAGSWVLYLWRQSSAGTIGWALSWLTVLAGVTLLWHWRLRSGRLLWSEAGLDDLRAVPDAPWRFARRLFGRLRRRRTTAAPAAADA
jgi:hypothetical protein